MKTVTRYFILTEGDLVDRASQIGDERSKVSDQWDEWAKRHGGESALAVHKARTFTGRNVTGLIADTKPHGFRASGKVESRDIYVPDGRTKAGKQARKEMRALDPLPDASGLVQEMFDMQPSSNARSMLIPVAGFRHGKLFAKIPFNGNQNPIPNEWADCEVTEMEFERAFSNPKEAA